MAVLNVTDVEETLRRVLRREAQELIQREVERSVKEGSERIKEGLTRMVSGLAFDIQRNVSAGRFTHELTVLLDVRGGEEKEKEGQG